MWVETNELIYGSEHKVWKSSPGVNVHQKASNAEEASNQADKMTQTADISHPRTGTWRQEQRSHSNGSEDGCRGGGIDSHLPRLNQATADSEYSTYEQQRPTPSPQYSTIPHADQLALDDKLTTCVTPSWKGQWLILTSIQKILIPGMGLCFLPTELQPHD